MARKITTKKTSKQTVLRSTSRTTSRRSPRTPDNESRRSAPADALTLLRDDHQAVSKLFDEYERRKNRLSDVQKQQLSKKISGMLKVHTQIEEELFYPALRQAERGDAAADLLDEADVEHASAKELIAQLEAEGTQSELFDAKVKVLGEYVKHHVKEEHEEIFPLARKAKLDLKALGAQLFERKQQLMQ
jgi:hemerythrin-like domain-containing protein